LKFGQKVLIVPDLLQDNLDPALRENPLKECQQAWRWTGLVRPNDYFFHYRPRFLFGPVFLRLDAETNILGWEYDRRRGKLMSIGIVLIFYSLFLKNGNNWWAKLSEGGKEIWGFCLHIKWLI